MGIRDDEIGRLIHYAKGLGARVTIYNKNHPDVYAEWLTDGSQINIYAGPGISKTEIILSLLHEISHHCWFIHEKDRQPDLKFQDAIGIENLRQEVGDKHNLTPQHLRKRIYDVELAGTEWWSTIVKDVNIKIPEWKIERQKELDLWIYEYYYETGLFPKGKVSAAKYKELTKKWRKK